jgi:hypothetical protein
VPRGGRAGGAPPPTWGEKVVAHALYAHACTRTNAYHLHTRGAFHQTPPVRTQTHTTGVHTRAQRVPHIPYWLAARRIRAGNQGGQSGRTIWAGRQGRQAGRQAGQGRQAGRRGEARRTNLIGQGCSVLCLSACRHDGFPIRVQLLGDAQCHILSVHGLGEGPTHRIVLPSHPLRRVPHPLVLRPRLGLGGYAAEVGGGGGGKERYEKREEEEGRGRRGGGIGEGNSQCLDVGQMDRGRRGEMEEGGGYREGREKVAGVGGGGGGNGVYVAA